MEKSLELNQNEQTHGTPVHRARQSLANKELNPES
jgi:hypothetical protein